MARSVLWIDSSEVAALLGANSSSSSSSRGTDRSPKSFIDEFDPFIQRDHEETHASSSRSREERTQFLQKPPAAFKEVSEAPFEEELDRFLLWIENTFHAPDCAVVDSDGFVVAGRNPSAHLLFPIEAAAFLAGHLDDMSEFSRTPLNGFYVFTSSRGYSILIWTEEHRTVRFFLNIQCEQLPTSRALNEISNDFTALFAKAP